METSAKAIDSFSDTSHEDETDVKPKQAKKHNTFQVYKYIGLQIKQIANHLF